MRRFHRLQVIILQFELICALAHPTPLMTLWALFAKSAVKRKF
jgi:hypothetical protein